MRNFFYILIIFVFCSSAIKADNFKIVFWNVENLFDCRIDTVKNDEDYRPEGVKKWNSYKYKKKLINVCKTIVACGKGDLPDIFALAEVENDTVISNLLHYTPLYKLNYQYYVTDSPDERGINIAFVYKRNRFKPLDISEINVDLSPHNKKTRNILLVTGLISRKDTIDIAVCHFPSRYGGVNETKKLRELANKRLSHVVDSISAVRKNPKIIVMGDFNDYPSDPNICHILNAVSPKDKKKNDSNLINLMWVAQPSFDDGIVTKGTHKYNGQWGFLDQFIVNRNIYDKKNYPRIKSIEYFNADFLFIPDNKHFGYRLKRTYYGYKYEEGYSDHLPIILELETK